MASSTTQSLTEVVKLDTEEDVAVALAEYTADLSKMFIEEKGSFSVRIPPNNIFAINDKKSSEDPDPNSDPWEYCSPVQLFCYRNSESLYLQKREEPAMDALDSVFDPFRDFAKDSVRLVKRCHKPDRKERCFQESKVAFQNASTFSSITALLEKLRLEVYGTNVKHANEEGDNQQPNRAEDEWKPGRSHKSSPNMHIISSIVDRTIGPSILKETEQIFLQCNEDQMAQLLSALWIEVNLPDNLPANIEAIAQSFCLALISCRLKNLNDTLILRFFQLPLSIRKIALDSNHGSSPPAYRRSLLVLSTAMMMFAAKLYHVAETRNLLNVLVDSDVDPHVDISDEFQVYVKSQSEVKDYGSASDNEEALLTLVNLRSKSQESDKVVLSLLVESLSTITKYESEDIAKQLMEGFVPDEVFMFGAQSIVDMDHFQRAAHSKGSQSFDGVPASPSPSMSHIVSIGQLLESNLHSDSAKEPMNAASQRFYRRGSGENGRWLVCVKLRLFIGAKLLGFESTSLKVLDKMKNTAAEESF
ncbi:Uncharacterized protein SHERM_16421 [Striga hermonthica]|uniref:Uncharacterized protein n=1 Tax=Striga hermonthica TaxID=68872 RepID=A0A9N7MWE0_STRHE|nr:Uncharacterized protein SHERM_16421 [Striga hermonthica]